MVYYDDNSFSLKVEIHYILHYKKKMWNWGVESIVIKSNKNPLVYFQKEKKNDTVACVVDETSWEENDLKYDLVF